MDNCREDVQPRRGCTSSRQLSIYKHFPRISIHSNHLPILNAAHCALDVEDGWDAVFSGNDGTVGKLAADFQYEAADEGENGRPAGVGCLGDKDFTGV